MRSLVRFTLVALILTAVCAVLGFAQVANQPYSAPEYYASSFQLWSINGQSPNTYIFQGRSLCNGQGQNLNFFDFNTNAPVLIADADSTKSERVTPSALINTAGSCGVTIAPGNNHFNFQLKSGTAGLQEGIDATWSQGAWPTLMVLDKNWWSIANQMPGTNAVAILNAAIGNDTVLLKDITTAPAAFYVWSGTNYIAGTWVNTPPVMSPGVATGSNLGFAGNYALLGYSGITCTGASTVAGGNIGAGTGSVSITGFPTPCGLTGPAVVDSVDSGVAQTNLAAAIVHYQGLTPTLSGLTTLSTGGNGISASTYTPGNYFGSGALTMTTGITCDALGDPNAQFVFVAGSTINLASGQSVLLTNGAQAKNVYFIAGSTFTSVATSTVNGNILAVTSVTLGGGTLNGKALANTGAVTISAATAVTSTSPLAASNDGRSTALIGTVNLATGSTTSTGVLFTETWATTSQFLYSGSCVVTSNGPIPFTAFTASTTYTSSARVLTVTATSAPTANTAYSFTYNCK